MDDIDIVLKELKNLKFIASKLNEFIDFLKFAQRYHFDSNINFGVNIGGFEHFAVLSLTQVFS